MLPYIIAVCIVTLSGCVGAKSYEVNFSYISPQKSNGEMSTINGQVKGSGYTTSTTLIEFERNTSFLNRQYKKD